MTTNSKTNMSKLLVVLDERKNQLQKMLPPNANWDDFVASVQLAFIHNPSLHNCTAASKMQALYDCAYAGLDIGGKQPHGYLVPRGTTCCFDLSYHGYIHLGLKSGAIESCRVGTIKHGDKVDYWRDGDGDHFTHHPNLIEPGQPTHFYALFKMADGSNLVSLMTVAEIEKHRDQYAMTRGAKTPWMTSFEAMAHKTVIRQPFLRGLIQIRDAAARRILDSEMVLDGEIVGETVSEPDNAVIDQIEQQGMTEAGVSTEPDAAAEELFEKHPQND